MTDLAVCNNILVNFDSHCKNVNNNDYLSFSIEKNLSNFKLIKISDIYNNLENNALEDKQLVFLDEQGREISKSAVDEWLTQELSDLLKRQIIEKKGSGKYVYYVLRVMQGNAKVMQEEKEER